MKDNKPFNSSQVARILEKTREGVSYLVDVGKLAATREPNGRMRITRSEVERYLGRPLTGEETQRAAQVRRGKQKTALSVTVPLAVLRQLDRLSTITQISRSTLATNALVAYMRDRGVVLETSREKEQL